MAGVVGLGVGEFIGIAADAIVGLGAAEDVAGDLAMFCGASFSGDTPVGTLSGETPISSLKVGDQVLAEDTSTGQVGSYPITATVAHTDPQVAHLTINGERIETTPDHRFFTEDRGWVAAGDLHPGERVHEANGQSGAVESVAVESQPRTMYDLTVDVAHTFFVGNQQWLVHNASCPFSLDELARAAAKPDGNGFTKAGRALQKHSRRIGSVFPRPSGTLNPATYNAAGLEVVEDILTDPGTVIADQNNRYFGRVYEAVDAVGRGLRFSSAGEFIGFLEP